MKPKKLEKKLRKIAIKSRKLLSKLEKKGLPDMDQMGLMGWGTSMKMTGDAWRKAERMVDTKIDQKVAKL